MQIWNPELNSYLAMSNSDIQHILCKHFHIFVCLLDSEKNSKFSKGFFCTKVSKMSLLFDYWREWGTMDQIFPLLHLALNVWILVLGF